MLRTLLLSITLALVWSLEVIAQSANPLPPSDHRNWQAVGRLYISGPKDRICTGTLVAPDLVLTAGHCVVSINGRSRVAPANIRFQAGYLDGASAAERQARVVRLANNWVLPNNADTLLRDLALIKLASPIRTVPPLPLAASSGAGPFRMLGYRFDRQNQLTEYNPCRITQPAPLILLDCAASEGTSGAPLLRRNGRGWAVAGVATATAIGVSAIAAPYDASLFR